MSDGRSIIDRFGILPGMRVSLVGVHDAVLIDGVRARAKEVVLDHPAIGSDVIVLEVRSLADLARVILLRGPMSRDTVAWVIWPTSSSQIKQSHVVAAGLAAGLTDVGSIMVSDELAALKLVVPIVERNVTGLPDEDKDSRPNP
jgi:hypothetical protein